MKDLNKAIYTAKHMTSFIRALKDITFYRNYIHDYAGDK